MSMIKPEKYVRKTFTVEAIEVTPENIHEVAEWCGGEVRESDLSQEGGREGFAEYIKVPVRKPLSDRQTRAYYEDWVLLGGMESHPTGFKVYTPRAFTDSFEKQVENMVEVLDRMDKRAAREERLEEEDDGPVTFDDLPGVRRTTRVDPLRPFQY